MIGWLSQTTMRRTPYQAFVVYTMEGFILKKIKGNETMKHGMNMDGFELEYGEWSYSKPACMHKTES